MAQDHVFDAMKLVTSRWCSYPDAWMSWLSRRRLDATVRRRRALEADLAIAEAQLVELAADADDLAVRAAFDDLGDRGMGGREARAAQRHHDALRRHRDHLRAQLAQLDTQQDRLLDELSRSRPPEP